VLGSVDWQFAIIARNREHEALRFRGDLDSISAAKTETFEPQPRHANVRNDLLAITIRAVAAADGCDE
jgi:hypothetical protein